MLRTKTWLIALAATALTAGSAHAQLKVGITMSASGPGAALGQPQSKTVPILPKEIAGQKVTYIALDDESDPTKAAQNARKMISEEKVDVLVGSSLTPVSLPLIDIAAEAKTPLLTLAAAAVLVQPMDDKKSGSSRWCRTTTSWPRRSSSISPRPARRSSAISVSPTDTAKATTTC